LGKFTSHSGTNAVLPIAMESEEEMPWPMDLGVAAAERVCMC